MNFSKAHVRRCFNRAKSTYDDYNHLQISIGKRLISLIENLSIAGDHILDVGCGTGVVTQALAASRPHRFLMGIDISDKLLSLAQHRLNQTALLLCADFDKIPAQNQQFDLIFSNMALQWSMNSTHTFAEMARVLRTHAHLAFAIPVDGTFETLKQKLYTLTGQQYLNTFESPQQIIKHLQSSGYQIVHHQLHEYHLFFLDLLSAFLSLKKLGADCGSSTLFLPKSIFRKAFTQGVTLDYSISLIIARKTHVI